MGDRLWMGKPFRYVTSQLGQLSLSCLRGWYIEYQPARLGWRRGGHLCRVADNTVWFHWQKASHSGSEVNFTKNYMLLLPCSSAGARPAKPTALCGCTMLSHTSAWPDCQRKHNAFYLSVYPYICPFVCVLHNILKMHEPIIVLVRYLKNCLNLTKHGRHTLR